MAQDTDDPYADYSHLWSDTKKKKKKETDTPPSENTVAQDTTRKPVAADSLQLPAADSIQTAPLDTVTSSTPATDPVPAVADTIPQPTIPSDTVVKQPEPEIIRPEEEKVEEDEPVTKDEPAPKDEPDAKRPKETKEKKNREIAPPAEDFRAGMGTMSGTSTVNGGFTMTQIDNQWYAGMTLQPEFSIWKIGLGLNVPVLFNIQDQTFRKDIYEGGIGVGRMITYIRYGTQKRDPVYVRVGQLNGTMIGFGGLVNNYTNSTSFEKRKVGLHYDLSYKGMIGMEGMYSDFDPTSKNLMVFRPYVRPLAITGIPVVRTLEIGTTVLSDKDQTAIPLSDSTSTTYAYTQQDGIGAFGIDAGMTLVRVPFIQIDAFFNYGKLKLASDAFTTSINSINPALDVNQTLVDGYADGKGTSYGINFRFNFIADILNTDVRIERLNYSDHYIPQFFDFTYELDKDAKIFSSAFAEGKAGIYGSLTGQILQKVELGGSLLIPDNMDATSPAVVRLNADVDRLGDKVSIHGTYFKGNLANLSDAFKLDERSIAKVRFIYHLNKFLAAGLDYYWAFTPVADGSYKATKYISPYFGLSIQF